MSTALNAATIQKLIDFFFILHSSYIFSKFRTQNLLALGQRVWILQNKIPSGMDGSACEAMGTPEA
ncbi:MAG: hypothetical protein N2A99_05300 [Carnobacterium alterfunditum]